MIGFSVMIAVNLFNKDKNIFIVTSVKIICYALIVTS